MSIPNCNEGRFMTITYEKMREKMEGIQSERKRRFDFIRKSIDALVKAYRGSLDLPSDTWQSIGGQEYSYVTLGVMIDGKYSWSPQTPIEFHIVNAAIATVVDDTGRGGQKVTCELEISTDRHAEELYVSVKGKNGGKVTVTGGDYREVCDLIKDVSYADISGYDDFR